MVSHWAVGFGIICSRRAMLIDLHTHTYPKSDDSFMSADDLIAQAKNLGLDGVCLTDHDAFWTLDETRALSRRHGLLVLPGTELNTDGGHVLVFGLDRYVFGVHKPPFLRGLVDRQGGVIIAAHPYRRRFLEQPALDPDNRRQMLRDAFQDPFFTRCDAVEELNGRGTEAGNRFSNDLAQQLGIPSTGGSDAHRLHQLGTAATRFHRRITGLEDLIGELRGGNFAPVDLTAAHANAASPR